MTDQDAMHFFQSLQEEPDVVTKPAVIPVPCPNCGRTYKLSGDKAGKRVKCKDCQTLITVPGGSKRRRKEQPAATFEPTHKVSVCRECGADATKRCEKCGDWICPKHLMIYLSPGESGSPGTNYEYCPDCHKKARFWGLVGAGLLGIFIVFAVIMELGKRDNPTAKPEQRKQVIHQPVVPKHAIKIDPTVWFPRRVPSDQPGRPTPEGNAMRQLNAIKVSFTSVKDPVKTKAALNRLIHQYPKTQAAEEAKQFLNHLPP